MTAAVTELHTSEETTGVTTITGEGLILNFCGPVRGWGVLTPGIFCCRAPTLLITNCVNTPPGEGRAAANKNLQVKNLQFSYFILLVIVFINHLFVYRWVHFLRVLPSCNIHVQFPYIEIKTLPSAHTQLL